MASLTAAVLEIVRDQPDLGATQIAHLLGCNDAYVRAVARRNSIRLPRSPYAAVPSDGASYRRARRLKGLN